MLVGHIVGIITAMREFHVRSLNQQDHVWAVSVLKQYWGSTRVVSRGIIHHADQLPGFIALDRDRPLGLVTYRLHNNKCEIITLNSLVENIGVGSALIEAVKDVLIFYWEFKGNVVGSDVPYTQNTNWIVRFMYGKLVYCSDEGLPMVKSKE